MPNTPDDSSEYADTESVPYEKGKQGVPYEKGKQVQGDEFAQTIDLAPKIAAKREESYELHLLRRWCVVCQTTWGASCQRADHESTALERPACAFCHLEIPALRQPEQPQGICLDCFCTGAPSGRPLPRTVIARMGARDRALMRALGRRADIIAAQTPLPGSPPSRETVKQPGSLTTLTAAAKRDALSALIHTLGAPEEYKGEPVEPHEPSDDGAGIFVGLQTVLRDTGASAVAVEIRAIGNELQGRILLDADVSVVFNGDETSLFDVAAMATVGKGLPSNTELHGPPGDSLLFAAMGICGTVEECHACVIVLDATGAPAILRSGWPLKNPRNTASEFFKWELLRGVDEAERDRTARYARKLASEGEHGDDVVGTIASTLAAWFATDEPNRRPAWWMARGGENGPGWISWSQHVPNVGAMKSKIAAEIEGAVIAPDMDVLGKMVPITAFSEGSSAPGNGENYRHEEFVRTERDAGGHMVVRRTTGEWDQNIKIHSASRHGHESAKWATGEVLSGYSQRDPTGNRVISTLDDPLGEGNRESFDKHVLQAVLLDRLDFTQAEIAERIGFSQQHVGRIIKRAYQRTVSTVTEV